MTSYLNQRGAVHILFLVVVLMLALAFGGLWFVQLQENEQLREDAAAATRARLAAADLNSHMDLCYKEIAPKVGGLPGQLPPFSPGTTAPEAMAAHKNRLDKILKELGARLHDPSIRPATLAEAVDSGVVELDKALAKLKTQEGLTEAARAEVAQLQARLADAESAKVAERQRLVDQHSTDKDTLTAQIDSLTTESTGLSNRVRDLTETGIQDREKYNEEVQDWTRRTMELNGQVSTLKSERKVERAKQVPDGKVVASDSERNRVFVNLGSDSLVRRNTRFQVFGVGKGGARTYKGVIAITDVMASMSEAYVEKSVPGQRIGTDDIIYSPVFSRDGSVHFRFLGQLNGRYPREVAERMLKNYGATIDDATSVRTDFLVLGERESEDDELLTETQDYRDAVRWGIEVLRARDLAPFLKQ